MKNKHIIFDPEKADLNWKKHYVSFETAALVFLDPARIERLDDSESNISGEERWQTLGRVGKLYFVVYTEPEDKKGEVIRLISARIATRTEQRSYNGHDDNSKGWTKAD